MNSLRDLLPSGFDRVPRGSHGWGHRLTHNLPAKLLALLAATVLWFYASADRRAIIEQSFDVPVTTRDNTALSDDGVQRAVSGLTPPSIKVTLRGRPDRLGEMREELIEAVVDVTNLPEGSFNQPVEVSPPAGTTLVRSMPDRVQGLVDTVQNRTLPVTLAVYDPGSAVMPNVTADPAEVGVSGPSRLVETVEQVAYAPTMLGRGETQEVGLMALDAQGQPVEGVSLSPNSVSLSRSDRAELPVKTVAVQLVPPPKGLQVTAEQLLPAQVRLVGPPEALQNITQVSGALDYREGSYSQQVRLLTPSGVQALDEVTATLTVTAVAPNSNGSRGADNLEGTGNSEDTASSDGSHSNTVGGSSPSPAP